MKTTKTDTITIRRRCVVVVHSKLGMTVSQEIKIPGWMVQGKKGISEVKE